MASLGERILRANPHTTVLEAPHGAVDPRLFFDVAERTEPESGQLPLWEVGEPLGRKHHEHHVHNRAATLDVDAAVDPAALADLLEDPPRQVHRIKAVVDVRTPRGLQRFVAHSVAGYVTVERASRAPDAPPHSVVVAIGPARDDAAPVRSLLDTLPRAAGDGVPGAPERRRLTRFV